MATGRISVTGKIPATPTRTGVLVSNIPTGFEIPGLDLTGCTKNYGITLSGIPAAGNPTVNLTTGDVTEDGAVSADEGVDHEGKDLGTIASIRMVAIIAPATNAGVITVESNVLSAAIPPGGFAIVALPGGLGGSYLSQPLGIQSEEDDEGLTIYSWNA